MPGSPIGSRELAMESAARASIPQGKNERELSQLSKSLARSVGNPQAIALCILADAIIATTAGEWKKASTLSQEALAILRDQCVASPGN